MNRTIHAACLCLLVVSCRSSKVQLPDDPLPFPEETQETAYIPTYSKEVLDGWPKGRAASPHDISRVRLGEQVHAYHLGRLPSHDRREMHEAHTVYRLEQESRWDTRLPATPMESRGVVLGIVEPSRQMVPDDTVIRQEREALMQKSSAMRKSMAELDVLRSELLNKKREFEKTEQDVAEIKEYLARTIQERASLQEQLKQSQARIEELEEAERFRIRSSSQGLVPQKK